MKLHAGHTWLFFSLIGWAWTVHASRLAGPYEAVFMWIAFQVDIYSAAQAAASGNQWTRSIATSFDSSTTFDEFLKGTLQSGVSWAGTSLLATESKYDTLDVLTVAQTLRSFNYPAGKVDFTKLFPTAATPTDANGKARPIQHRDIMNPLIDVIENGYELQLPTKGAFNNARDAMDGIQGARWLENQGGLDALVDLLFEKADGLSKYGMVRSNDAITGDIDWLTTLKSGTGDLLDKTTALMPLITEDYTQVMTLASTINSAAKKAVKSTATHSKVLENVQGWWDKLNQFAERSICL